MNSTITTSRTLATEAIKNLSRLPLLKNGCFEKSKFAKWLNGIKLKGGSHPELVKFLIELIMSPGCNLAEQLRILVIKKLLSLETIFICFQQLFFLAKIYATNQDIIPLVNSRVAKLIPQMEPDQLHSLKKIYKKNTEIMALINGRLDIIEPKFGNECLHCATPEKNDIVLPIQGWNANIFTPLMTHSMLKQPPIENEVDITVVVETKRQYKFSQKAFLKFLEKKLVNDIRYITEEARKRVEMDVTIVFSLLYQSIDKLMITKSGAYVAKVLIETLCYNKQYSSYIEFINSLLKKYCGLISTAQYCDEKTEIKLRRKIALSKACLVYFKCKNSSTSMMKKYNITEKVLKMLLNSNDDGASFTSIITFSLTYYKEHYFMFLFNEVLKRKDRMLIRDSGNMMLTDFIRELLKKKYKIANDTFCDESFLRLVKYLKLLSPSFDVNTLFPKCDMCKFRFQDNMCMSTCNCDSSYIMCRECTEECMFCYSCEKTDIKYVKIFNSTGNCCSCGMENSNGHTCNLCMSELCSNCTSNCKCCKGENIRCECPMCYEIKEVLFFGCGHRSYCGDCQESARGSKYLMECSMCRKKSKIEPKMLKNLPNSNKQ
jgi:hypothetical protein